MGKYNYLKTLKQTKARGYHICRNCGKRIFPGEIYFREFIADKFLHNVHAQKYCQSCYAQYREKLMQVTKTE